MADRNTIYNGVQEYFDPKADSGLRNPKTCNWFGGNCSNYWLEELPSWPAFGQINQQSSSTRDAVRVAYQIGTDRTGWLKDRIDAIDKRVSFIRGRVSDLLDYIQSINGDTAVALEKGFTTALSLLPGIGPAITLIEGGANAARQLEAAKTQLLIQQYTEDIKELAAIRSALVTEYTKAGTVSTEPDTTQTTNEAPNPYTTYYYLAGAGVLLLLLLYWKNKRKKRR